MNVTSTVVETPHSDAAPNSSTAPTSSRLASALRWLGSLAVLAAGAVFMLQGFENVTAGLRNWTFIALMLAFAGAAFMSQRLFEDAKGARLLFGLAMLLVPVQFSQLGGLIHEAMLPLAEQGGSGPLQQWLPTLASPTSLLMMLLASAAIGLAVLKAGYTVLTRDLARPLTLYMAVFISALLIPARASFAGALVVIGPGAGYLLALRSLDFRSPRLRTFEGRAALSLLAVPLVIAAVRFALHADGFGAFCAIAGLGCVAFAELPRRLAGVNGLTATCALLGMFGAACSWALYAVFTWHALPETISGALVVLPIAAYWLESSRGLGGAGYLVRFCASVLMLLLGLSLLEVGAWSASIELFAISGLFLLWAVWRRMREPSLFAAALLALAVVQMLMLALVDVQVNGWLLLAGGGLLLVVGASALEQHGRKLLLQSKTAWSAVRQWS